MGTITLFTITRRGTDGNEGQGSKAKALDLHISLMRKGQISEEFGDGSGGNHESERVVGRPQGRRTRLVLRADDPAGGGAVVLCRVLACSTDDRRHLGGGVDLWRGGGPR